MAVFASPNLCSLIISRQEDGPKRKGSREFKREEKMRIIEKIIEVVGFNLTQLFGWGVILGSVVAALFMVYTLIPIVVRLIPFGFGFYTLIGGGLFVILAIGYIWDVLSRTNVVG